MAETHTCDKYGCPRRVRWGLAYCIAYDCYRKRPGSVLNERGWRGVWNALVATVLGRRRRVR